MNAIFSKQFIVKVHELHLSDRGEELSLLYGVEFILHFHLASSARDSTGRNEDDLIAMLFQPGNLVNKCRKACDIEFSLVGSQDIRAHFHHNTFHNLLQ